MHEAALKELEESASTHSDILSTLQSTVDHLTMKVKHLDEKCEDLKAPSRRNNIRIIRIPEGKEGPRPRDFIAQLLTEALSLPEKPLIDRAHRRNRQKSKPEDPLWPFILRLHYYHTHEEILWRAMEKNNLEYRGQKIYIFPDFPPSVVKQWAAFTKVRELLQGRSDVRNRLIYASRLMVTCGGGKMLFTTQRKLRIILRNTLDSHYRQWQRKGHTRLPSWVGSKQHTDISAWRATRGLGLLVRYHSCCELLLFFLFLFSLFSLLHPLLFPSLVINQKSGSPHFLLALYLMCWIWKGELPQQICILV